MSAQTGTVNVEPRLKSILEQEYPRFSDAEYARRHQLLGEVMAIPRARSRSTERPCHSIQH